MSTNHKDRWDKVDILTKFIASVVLVFIPIVIGFGADRISQSMEGGKIIQLLISDFAQNQQQRRKDFALIALDTAMPQKKECTILWLFNCKTNPDKDTVIDAAVLSLSDLVRRASTSPSTSIEIETTKKIITKRSDRGYFCKMLKEISSKVRATSALDPNSGSDLKDKKRKARANTIIITLFDDNSCSSSLSESPSIAVSESPSPSLILSPNDFKIVYIQYRSDIDQAKRLKEALQNRKIYTPGIEQVNGIKENSM